MNSHEFAVSEKLKTADGTSILPNPQIKQD